MANISISYFRELLSKNITALQDRCKEWEEICSLTVMPEDVSDEIRTTIGLANLLMRQKLKQFGELIDDSENKTGEKEITCMDLEGFWDMVYHEVKKIQTSFSNLEKCQSNNWVLVNEPIVKVELKKKLIIPENGKPTSNANKAHALAARQRLAEAKLKMRQQFVKKQQSAVENTAVLNIKSGVNYYKEEVATENGMVHDGQLKQTLKNIENLQITKQNEQLMKKSASEEHLNSGQQKEKSLNKNKENLLSEHRGNFRIRSKSQKNTPEGSPALLAKRTSKEFIPLQCVTRSAKKALLEAQNV